jgi:hypothetical protein
MLQAAFGADSEFGSPQSSQYSGKLRGSMNVNGVARLAELHHNELFRPRNFIKNALTSILSVMLA